MDVMLMFDVNSKEKINPFLSGKRWIEDERERGGATSLVSDDKECNM